MEWHVVSSAKSMLMRGYFFLYYLTGWGLTGAVTVKQKNIYKLKITFVDGSQGGVNDDIYEALFDVLLREERIS